VRVLICGAGGFIGSHLVRALKKDGHWVRGADLHLPEYDESPADEFRVVDLRDYNNCLAVTKEVDYVYNLAADMGGIGYITAHLADIAHNNTLINVNMLEAARVNRVERYLFSSSACVYAQSKQQTADVVPLKEEDAYPADPEPGYGWEKLYAEQLCKYYQHDYGMNIKVARFHNVYGQLGTYDGGREKSPAALCRKVALAEDGDSIEIWGDGKQTRSYMHVADCCDGLMRLMGSEYKEPINLGRDEWVTVNGLVDKIAGIAGKKIKKQHDTSKPQGVRGRNSDNTLLKKVLNWEPEINLERGLRYTYPWIEAQIRHQKFYSQFMNPDELVFDIGANIGNKSKVFLNLGCRVIAVEPQSYCIEYLTTRFSHEPGRIAVISKAVANNNDSVIMALGTHRGVSTACPGWLQAVKGTKRFVGVDWVGTQHVQTTTLDQLIEVYGVPVFIKIDVEGFESKVIQGLSQPVKGMSFEFHPEYLADTKKGIEHLTTLGEVEFNYSLEESMTMCPEWLSAENIISALDEFVGNNTIYGDVYARFV